MQPEFIVCETAAQPRIGHHHGRVAISTVGGPIPCVAPVNEVRDAALALELLCADIADMKAQQQREGALLLRGLGLTRGAEFRAVVGHFCSRLSDYAGGTSPRTGLGDGLYTSTEHPAERTIALHNEMSYHHNWPAVIAFFCERPPATGGETPIADGREILDRLPDGLVRRFDERGIAYTRVFPSAPRFAGSWERTFGSADPAHVAASLEAQGIDYRWGAGGALHTREVRPALQRHPRTGELVWFNQAHMWHVSNLPGFEDEENLPAEEDLPMNASFGDGSPISAADLQLVRAALQASERSFHWATGDLVLLDNVLFAHGRRPYTGERRILVAMGET